MVERLEAADLVGLIDMAICALKAHKDEINAMNVFPVPDGDTGTNMLLTMQAVQEAILSCAGRDMSSVCQAISRGSLMGARGNSGVVLSQILKGMAEVMGENEAVDVGVMASALTRGSEVAYRAVMKPVEGTILTVMREASEEGARSKDGQTALEQWFTGVLLKAREALDHTPELLPVLKDAGVVDAGGRGLLAIFEGFLAYLTGEELQAIEEEVSCAAAREGPQVEDFRYEAQFILHCKDGKAERLRDVLHELGGSVLVVGSDKLYRVHVHTDMLGRVIEEASGMGRMSDVEITDLKLQVEELGDARARREEKPVGVVAVAVGDGIKEVLRSMGVDHIVDGGQSMNPSTAEMLDAVEELPQDTVLLVPNNKNIIPAAEQARELAGKRVMVVPATSIAEGFAAMVAYDARAGLEGAHARMSLAMEGVKTGAVTVAVRDSRGMPGEIAKGDYVGLFRGEIVAAAPDAPAAARALLAKMIGEEDEIVSMIIGDEAHGLDHAGIMDLIEGGGLEVEVIDGGQPVYHYIFGVE